MTTFRQLLDQFEESAKTRTAKGRRFEEFCEAYFQADPLWTERFDAVWSWMDWPGRNGRADTGVDLVAREVGSGNLVAIQCKFYAPSATLDWGHVSTFVGMLGQPEFTSGLLVSTAGKESKNVQPNLDNNGKDVRIWRVADFEESRIDWDQFRLDEPNRLNLVDAKQLRPHQEKAVLAVEEGFELNNRGQLVMACGTGKTFTSLRLAESQVGAGGSVLFLVPSINLLSQAVKSWANDAVVPLATFAVCSDIRAGQRTKSEDMNVNDLAFPASTNPESLLGAMHARASVEKMTVVFSTYQSIDVITACQAAGVGEFDLIICDEAHRTTGAFKEIDDQSVFTKVHQNEFVSSKKRLYMTATPRVYGDQTKAKAASADVIVASMDDETVFGEIFHELPFGEAVAQKLLTDYKVLVLAVDEESVSGAFQRQLAREDGEVKLDDVARMVGCWHGLSKRGPQFEGDTNPMQRAVAFSSTIKQSKAFTKAFPEIVNDTLQDRADSNAVRIETDHVDGKTNVKVRSEAIAWLEEPPGQQVCRVLSNAKCLTEGVDVPALDAILFLQPRQSIVDVVQAVGRVMRLAEGKEFGYVILPIGVPAGVAPQDALRDNKRYRVVWQVLQALRSHDERLAAEINKIDINDSSSQIEVIGIGVEGGDDPDEPGVTTTAERSETTQLTIPDLGEWRSALYARIVEKVGDRRYMETWAGDIKAIADAQETRIRTLLDHPDQNPEAVERFDEFLVALRNNLNDGVTKDDAIGMLSQHLITRPVFEALFGSDEFTRLNPVSQVMQTMIETLDGINLGSETATLEGFYNHIRMLIGGIETAEGRQRVITELYEKFFRKALPKTAESLGIVYTPVEIVDFINRSVNDVLGRHFDGASLADRGVQLLDPFAGTGTFISRLLQCGLLGEGEQLVSKYRTEIHANEILLLAYYIASINIETAFHGLVRESGYQPFEGIVLADTFQMTEQREKLDLGVFPRNNERASNQLAQDIRVIIGNPPYSVGQASQGDANENVKYEALDAAIEKSYSAKSGGSKGGSLYDSYVRAIRWASNRVGVSEGGGVVGFVTNGGWLDSKSGVGIRRSLAEEFDHIYVFNLRGNTRGSGERVRREGGKVFGQGSRNTVAIALLVKLPKGSAQSTTEIRYRDVGDYLSAEQKLEIVNNADLDSGPWVEIVPNSSGDWLNQRRDDFDRLLPLTGGDGLFVEAPNGLKTNRDAWVYNASVSVVEENVAAMVEHYNSELVRFQESVPHDRMETLKRRSERARHFVEADPSKFAWNYTDFDRLAAGLENAFTTDMVRVSLYRPFFKLNCAFDPALVRTIGRLPALLPEREDRNPGIAIVQPGSRSPFGVVATDVTPCLHLIGSDATSVLCRWRYPDPGEDLTLDLLEPGRASNLRPEAVARIAAAVGRPVTDDDVFSYVYGVLHSQSLRFAFEANFKKERPRVPVPADREAFDAFADAGRELLALHIDYEDVEPYPLLEEWVGDPAETPSLLLVDKKMTYPMVLDEKLGKKVADKTRLKYNDHLTLAGIPPKAQKYDLGTRSAIDWLVDRYFVKTDKDSGIVNDPNQWGLERGEPRYIIDLIKRVVTVSVRTVEIVESLPELEF